MDMNDLKTHCTDCFFHDRCDYVRINGEGRVFKNSPCCDFKDKSKIVELPCKVGDAFWGITENSCTAYAVIGFKYGILEMPDKLGFIILAIGDREFIWGEEAFLTKEEAEAKLKEEYRKE